MKESILSGKNMGENDFAKWTVVTPDQAPNCLLGKDASKFTRTTRAYRDDGSSYVSAPFTFILPGMSILCYKWNYNEPQMVDLYEPTAFLLFPDMQALALQFDSALPTGHSTARSSARAA